MSPRVPTKSGVGVLDKTIAVFDAIEHGHRSVASIARATGFHRATVHRLVAALEFHGFLEWEGGGGYRYGSRLLRLATSSLREIPLRDLGHRALERLTETTGESSQLFVRVMAERVCVDAIDSPNELRAIVRVGARLPLTAGSAGKVFLAWTDPADRDELIEHAERFTDDTLLGEDLHREMMLIRRRGWASSSGERQPGVGSVSAPIRRAADRLLGVVSLSGPTGRIGRISAKRYAPAVLVAAREIERAAGYQA